MELIYSNFFTMTYNFRQQNQASSGRWQNPSSFFMRLCFSPQEHSFLKNSISIRNHTQSQTQCTAANKTRKQIAGGHKYCWARCLQRQHHKQARARVRRLKELLRAFQFVPPAAKKPHGIVVCCTLYPLTHTHIYSHCVLASVCERAQRLISLE